MANFTILDAIKHRNTRVITGRGAQFGENVHLIPVIAEELNHLSLEYPVCLIKDNETGRFGLNALLGFEAGENLLLENDTWNTNYVPLHIRRQPFMVAVKGGFGDQPTEDNTVITINMNNTRVQEESGELLFDEQGNLSKYMTDMNRLLSTLVNGIMRTDAFINKLLEHELIEAVQLKVTFSNGEEKNFEGVYTIHEENLKNLNIERLSELHSAGYLQACYMLKMSLGNIQKLVKIKNNKI